MGVAYHSNVKRVALPTSCFVSYCFSILIVVFFFFPSTGHQPGRGGALQRAGVVPYAGRRPQRRQQPVRTGRVLLSPGLGAVLSLHLPGAGVGRAELQRPGDRWLHPHSGGGANRGGRGYLHRHQESAA